MQRKVHDMEVMAGTGPAHAQTFLADYGMVWVGSTEAETAASAPAAKASVWVPGMAAAVLVWLCCASLVAAVLVVLY